MLRIDYNCKVFFFFNDTATTEIYTLSLHDALPICVTQLTRKGGQAMNWNPWKVAAIAMALVMGTALVTGLVVANWVGIETKPPVTTRPASPPARRQAQMPAFPTQAVVDACNEYAAAQAGGRG